MSLIKMVLAWYFDNDLSVDYREPHQTNPPNFLSLEDLKKKTGVEYFKVDADSYQTCDFYKKIKDDRGITYEDEIVVSREKLPNYDEKIKHFYEEHLHSDEEIRYILGGKGYFDVRDDKDAWVRIECVKDDLLVMPAGIYHRFTIDKNDYIQAKRLFAGNPVWTPINRPEADSHESRIAYLKELNSQP